VAIKFEFNITYLYINYLNHASPGWWVVLNHFL